MNSEGYSEYFSQKVTGLKLASRMTLATVSLQRHDLTDPSAELQVSARKYSNGFTVKPHSHLKLERHTSSTAESWVVMRGSVEALLFDVDDAPLGTVLLKEGDCMVFFNGGHGLHSGSEGAVVYEFKNGPYFGVELDKREI
jgi:mannose-6-phosphate isomerase-like protein (cupin superfamily)